MAAVLGVCHLMLIPELLAVGFASMTNRVTSVPTADEITSGRAIVSRKGQNHERMERLYFDEMRNFLLTNNKFQFVM